MAELRQTSVFAKWLGGLRDRQARARIQVRLDRLALGLAGDVKPVGSGVSELRVDHGPGYRVYFTRKGVMSSSSWPEETSGLRIATYGEPWHWPATFRSV